MALADYRLCDVCGAKTFYDETLHYDFEEYPVHGLRLGAWAVICDECAKTFEVIVRPRVTAAQLAVAADAMRAAEVPDDVIGALTRQPSRSRDAASATVAELMTALQSIVTGYEGEDEDFGASVYEIARAALAKAKGAANG